MRTPYKLNSKHFQNVVQLPAGSRYDYFINKVADWQDIWSLKSADGWTTAADDLCHKLVPVWPHPLFAEMCAHGERSNAKASKIALCEWLDEWIPSLIENGELVAVFPVPDGTGTPVTPQQVRHDLRRELRRIEQ